MKKILAVVLAVISLMTLIGCRQRSYLLEYESGYFKYAVKTEKDGTKKAYLTGLTESGQELKEIIYPEEIDGITVYGIGYEKSLGIGSEYVGSFGSDNLEKVYFPIMPKNETANDCLDNLYIKTYAVYWDLGSDKNSNRLMGVKNAIFGFNYIEFGHWTEDYLNPLIANVSYMYNYSEAPNEGYYWVDSYNESIITFIPPEPKREGYKFEGWYKEPECINKWNFDTDITGKEIVIGQNVYDTYNGIYLYVKWINK